MNLQTQHISGCIKYSIELTLPKELSTQLSGLWAICCSAKHRLIRLCYSLSQPFPCLSVQFWSKLGKMVMLITLFFAVPLNMLPAREMLFSSIGIEKTNRNHIIVCVALAASSCGIAMGFQNVTTYFGLLGGTAGTMLAGTYPFSMKAQSQHYAT